MHADLSKQTFHELTVVKRTLKPNGSKGSIYWLCSCSCGGEAIVSTQNLRANLVKSCGCLKRRRHDSNPNWKGHKELSYSYWSSVMRHASDRNIKVSINIEDAWNQFEKQERRCALSNRPICFDVKTHTTGTTASLDRRDSSKGYTIENIQWLHKDVNLIKSDLSQDEFIALCVEVSEHFRKKS